MKTLFLTTALLVAALFSIPEHAAAQSGCITPEHCVNPTGGGDQDVRGRNRSGSTSRSAR